MSTTRALSRIVLPTRDASPISTRRAPTRRPTRGAPRGSTKPSSTIFSSRRIASVLRRSTICRLGEVLRSFVSSVASPKRSGSRIVSEAAAAKGRTAKVRAGILDTSSCASFSITALAARSASARTVARRAAELLAQPVAKTNNERELARARRTVGTHMALLGAEPNTMGWERPLPLAMLFTVISLLVRATAILWRVARHGRLKVSPVWLSSTPVRSTVSCEPNGRGGHA